MRYSRLSFVNKAGGDPLDEKGLLALPGQVLIEGPPAHGKTMFLSHLALAHAGDEAAQRVFGMEQDEAGIAVLFPFRSQATLTDGVSRDYAAALLKGHPAVQGVGLPDTFPDTLLDSGCLIFLGDGLDEIADPAARVRALNGWAQALNGPLQGSRMFTTTRPTPDLPVAEDWSQVRLCGIHPEALGTFLLDATAERGIRRLKRGVARAIGYFDEGGASRDADFWRSAGRLGETLPRFEDVLPCADYLTRELATHPVWKQWGGSPMILEHLGLYLASRGRPFSLPDSLYRFFDEQIFKSFIEDWADRAEAGKFVIGLYDQEDFLGAIALAMTVKGLRDFPINEAASILRPLLAEKEVEVSPEDYLKTMMGYSGILLDVGGDQFCFSHFSVQQFLAAGAIHRDRSQRYLSGVFKRMRNPWWQMIGLFLFDAAYSNVGAFSNLLSYAVSCGVKKEELEAYLQMVGITGWSSSIERKYAEIGAPDDNE